MSGRYPTPWQRLTKEWCYLYANLPQTLRRAGVDRQPRATQHSLVREATSQLAGRSSKCHASQFCSVEKHLGHVLGRQPDVRYGADGQL
jgi:hypothetical protein